MYPLKHLSKPGKVGELYRPDHIIHPSLKADDITKGRQVNSHDELTSIGDCFKICVEIHNIFTTSRTI